MILPSTYLFSILLLVLGMICSGLWASTFKAAGGKWRFELYYFDFSLGVIFAALLAATVDAAEPITQRSRGHRARRGRQL